MNLLVGLSVSDINTLMKTGKRDQLRSQIELISYVLKFRCTKLFQLLSRCGCLKYFPICIQTWFGNDADKVTVYHSDPKDTRYPLALRHLLFKHCLDMEKETEETEMKVIRKSLREKDDKERQILNGINNLRKSLLEKEERDKQILYELKNIISRLPKL